jgi:phage/plasmid-associated DNA primase
MRPMQESVAKLMCEAHIAEEQERECSRFLQLLMGMALTGTRDEEVFVLVRGDASSGKSKFFELLQAVLGDFVQQVDSALVVKAKHGRGDGNSHKATLHDVCKGGVRILSMSELEQNEKMASRNVKQLGGENIQEKMRACHGQPEKLQMSCIPFLASNYDPKVENALETDSGIERRALYFEFLAKFGHAHSTRAAQVWTQAKYDASVSTEKETLERGETPWHHDHFPRADDIVGALTRDGAAEGVLRWCAEGAQLWNANGKTLGAWPGRVDKATKAYIGRENTFDTFLAEKCAHSLPGSSFFTDDGFGTITGAARFTASEMGELYGQQLGVDKEDVQKLGAALEKLGYKIKQPRSLEKRRIYVHADKGVLHEKADDDDGVQYGAVVEEQAGADGDDVQSGSEVVAEQAADDNYNPFA